MAVQKHHICVCICTFKRLELLGKLLKELEKQRTEELFSYSVVVTDNDPAQSARDFVKEFSSISSLKVIYAFEPQPNIALARNRALANAQGDFIAFIDDDEYPESDWLFNLYKVCMEHKVDGVLGPVQPYFESVPPVWVTKGKFFDRPTHETGYRVPWEEARTGNVLFRREILEPGEPPFRSQFDTAGEDVDFFRRMMEKGRTFIWCNEAVAHELVPASRCNREYLLRRALLRGSNFHKHPTDRLKNAAKSLVAVPCYTLALPVLALFGQHVFLKYLIKLLDHGSRLMAYVGISAVTQRHT
ncbi:MAG TPA: glycosyltransferase [Candidatus Limnocylindrales bacterium]|nr:glycosyltransferase [Candidatus Limnocylindrales bacterium]